jgi:hypothetical protein
MYSICTSYATSLSRHVPSVGATAAWQRKCFYFGSLYEIEGFGFKPSPGALAGRCQFGDRSEVAGQRPARERQLSVHFHRSQEFRERQGWLVSGPTPKPNISILSTSASGLAPAFITGTSTGTRILHIKIFTLRTHFPVAACGAGLGPGAGAPPGRERPGV